MISFFFLFEIHDKPFLMFHPRAGLAYPATERLVVCSDLLFSRFLIFSVKTLMLPLFEGFSLLKEPGNSGLFEIILLRNYFKRQISFWDILSLSVQLILFPFTTQEQS